MRATRWLLGLSTSFTVVACVASGCGGGTSSNPPVDSGTADATNDVVVEATVEAAAEAAAPEAAVDAACVPDANINNLPVPDASFGDAGATAESCISCFKTNCTTLIATCNQDCACVAAFEQVESCLGVGGALTTCGAPLLGISGITFTQLACALPCASPSVCGYALPTGGDSGTNGDSATGDGAAE